MGQNFEVSNSGIVNAKGYLLDGVTFSGGTGSGTPGATGATGPTGDIGVTGIDGYDGITGMYWVAEMPSSQEEWVDVAYGAGKFAALSTRSGVTVMTTVDGYNWENTYSPAEAKEWRALTYGTVGATAIFIAVGNNSGMSGDDGDVMISPDAINWTDLPAITPYAYALWNDVVCGGTMAIAIGYDGATGGMAIGSTNGVDWAYMSSPEISSKNWESITYGNGKFVAVSGATGFGEDQVLVSTDDGATWNLYDSVITGVTGVTGYDVAWHTVEYANVNGTPTFVAFGTTGDGMISNDGMTWVGISGITGTSRGSFNTSFNGVVESIAYGAAGITGNSMFAGVCISGNENRLVTAVDGSTWISQDPPGATGVNWRAIAYGNNRFVAVGDYNGSWARTMSSHIGKVVDIEQLNVDSLKLTHSMPLPGQLLGCNSYSGNISWLDPGKGPTGPTGAVGATGADSTVPGPQGNTGQTGAAGGDAPGVIKMYGGSSAPTGYFLCDGTAYSSTTYADLYSVIGTIYGSGATGEFRVPDLTGRFALGWKSSTYGLGTTGGAATHTLTVDEIPAHTHNVCDVITEGTGDGASGNFLAAHNPTSGIFDTGSTGGSGAHNNMPPYAVVNYIIKY